ncbi:hypothetical protein CLV42_108162 [Chitinophaga ginsengisoli]|uniref:Uncharacterized protein n=1 Tax=Chitinophaga ginsengisoli TaxID=363837 RepID=A0A2P8G2P2_9BACT|nr:hypothetical protein CLV42_108162 [Chitinophaga ginsengisoli]
MGTLVSVGTQHVKLMKIDHYLFKQFVYNSLSNLIEHIVNLGSSPILGEYGALGPGKEAV